MSSISGVVSSSSTGTTDSGLDVQATVDQLMYTERAPERIWQAQQATIQSQKAAMTDLQSKLGTLDDQLNSLGDIMGVFAQRTADSSDSSLVSTSVSSAAATGTHTVVVSRLASVSSWYTAKPLAGATTTFAAGSSFDIKVNGVSKHVVFDTTNNTLQGAADYLNTLGLDMKASVVTDANGARLALVATNTGATGGISITNDTTGLGATQATAGQNALLTVDGVPMESASNTVSTALPGVTLKLTGADSSQPVTIDVAQDTSGIEQAVQSFVGTYNSVVTSLNQQFAFSASSSSQGVLAGDTNARVVQEMVLGIPAFAMTGNGALQTLSSMGVSMNNDGTLTVDGTKLSSAVGTSADAVKNFFDTTVSGSFGQTISQRLSVLNDSTNGVVTLDLSGMDATNQALQDQIDQFEVRMTAREKQLMTEYENIDVALREFSATQSQVAQQLASLQSS